MVFFSIGVAVLSGSILCDDLIRYFHNKYLLKAAEKSLNRLESLNADYDALLEQLEKDPNLLKRIVPATLGVESADANAVYPKVAAEQLAAARKVLLEDISEKASEPVVPEWLTRCNEFHRRIMLFFAGAFLVVISFICFGSTKKSAQDKQ